MTPGTTPHMVANARKKDLDSRVLLTIHFHAISLFPLAALPPSPDLSMQNTKLLYSLFEFIFGKKKKIKKNSIFVYQKSNIKYIRVKYKENDVFKDFILFKI